MRSMPASATPHHPPTAPRPERPAVLSARPRLCGHLCARAMPIASWRGRVVVGGGAPSSTLGAARAWGLSWALREDSPATSPCRTGGAPKSEVGAASDIFVQQGLSRLGHREKYVEREGWLAVKDIHFVKFSTYELYKYIHGQNKVDLSSPSLPWPLEMSFSLPLARKSLLTYFSPFFPTPPHEPLLKRLVSFSRRLCSF